eukprot:366270-Chlamydomonas_euryale.AAC.3
MAVQASLFCAITFHVIVRVSTRSTCSACNGVNTGLLTAGQPTAGRLQVQPTVGRLQVQPTVGRLKTLALNAGLKCSLALNARWLEALAGFKRSL